MSRITLYERVEICRKQLKAYERHPNDPQRVDLCMIADQMARDEMLDEVHAMLTELLAGQMARGSRTIAHIEYGDGTTEPVAKP